MKPTDEIKPEIKPEPEQFDNNTPRTKEEWFKSKWKTEKYAESDQIYGEIENLKKYYGIKIDDFRIFCKGWDPLLGPLLILSTTMGMGSLSASFVFLEKNFKRSNPFKRRIPIYISIKYRSTFFISVFLICICIFNLYLFYICILICICIFNLYLFYICIFNLYLYF